MPYLARCPLFAVLAIAALFATQAAAADLPPAPGGKRYVQSMDGCGQLIDPAQATESVVQSMQARLWLGECRHGLAHGLGVWLDPNDTFMPTQHAYLQYGEHRAMNATISAPAGISDSKAGAETTISLTDPATKRIRLVGVPAIWRLSDPYAPIYGTDNGTNFDDYNFSVQELARQNGKIETVRGVMISAEARNCLAAGRKISGCKAVYSEFPVYGVAVRSLMGRADDEDSFTLCPDPRSTRGCDSLWRAKAQPILDEAVAVIQEAQKVMAAEQAAYAEEAARLEAAFPAAWTTYWREHPADRRGIDMALKCRELTDFAPTDLTNAVYVRQKYTTAPCNAAATAAYATKQADTFIAIDSNGRNQDAAIRQAYAEAKAKLDRENAEAWQGFFRTTDAMLSANLVLLEDRQRREAAAAAAAAEAQAAAERARAEAAARAGGGPARSPASDDGPTDPSKVYVRPIHRPELDAGGCVQLAMVSSGESSTSGGGRVFSNQCGQTVEVGWCRVNGECDRGIGNSVSIGAGRSWPAPSTEIRWSACRGANSGGLIKDENGIFVGRYACTGP